MTGSSFRNRRAGGSVPPSSRWMDAAARLPSPMASIRLRGPNATSPPANTSRADVARVSRSTSMVPRGPTDTPSSGESHDRAGAWPIARITESHGNTDSVPSANFGSNRPSGSNTDVTRRVSSPVTEPSPRIRFGPRRWRMRMPSSSASWISKSVAGISSRDSSATTRTSRAPMRTAARAASRAAVAAACTPSSTAEEGAAGAAGLPVRARSAVRAASRATLPPPITTTRSPSSTWYPRLALMRNSTARRTPSRSAPGIRRSRLRMAPTPRNVAANPWPLRSPSEEIASQPDPGPELHPEVQDGPDLPVQEVAAEAVGRDPEHHHAAGPVLALEHDGVVAVGGQVVREGQAGGACPDDGHPFLAGRPGVDRLPPPPGAVLALHPATLAGEPLEGPDGDGLVDHAPAAGQLARRSAHPAADGREGVRHPRRQVGRPVVAGRDGADVAPGPREHRTGLGARDVLVEPVGPDGSSAEPGVHRRLRCSTTNSQHRPANDTVIHVTIRASRAVGVTRGARNAISRSGTTTRTTTDTTSMMSALRTGIPSRPRPWSAPSRASTPAAPCRSWLLSHSVASPGRTLSRPSRTRPLSRLALLSSSGSVTHRGMRGSRRAWPVRRAW